MPSPCRLALHDRAAGQKGRGARGVGVRVAGLGVWVAVGLLLAVGPPTRAAAAQAQGFEGLSLAPGPAGGAVGAPSLKAGSGADEASSLTRLVDPSGRELLVTGLQVGRGDRFLDPTNGLYEVVSVRRGVAQTHLVGRAARPGHPGLPLAWQEAPGIWWPPEAGLTRAGSDGRAVDTVMAAAGTSGRLLAVYHTHSDESYLPDSGVTNRPWNGDIFEVGRVLSLMWRSVGLGVLHSYNRHDPHDGLAYARSRRTAVELLRQGPAALIDVHRDTPPAHVYRRFVNGQQLASVLLVVGRQNPTLGANEAFALAIKEYADRAYPQLIRGILYAAGDYNQDLHPRALLIEVGSTYNRLEEARQGARLFSGVVPAVLYGIRIDPERMPALPPPQAVYRERSSRAGWRAAAYLLVLAVAGGSLYLLLSENAYEQAWRGWTRLREQVARRLANLRR